MAPLSVDDRANAYTNSADRPTGVSAWVIEDGMPVIPAGEMFCRYADDEGVMCSVTHKYESTNALRAHVRRDIENGGHGIKVKDGVKGRMKNSDRHTSKLAFAGAYDAVMANAARLQTHFEEMAAQTTPKKATTTAGKKVVGQASKTLIARDASAARQQVQNLATQLLECPVRMVGKKGERGRQAVPNAAAMRKLLNRTTAKCAGCKGSGEKCPDVTKQNWASSGCEILAAFEMPDDESDGSDDDDE
ncbi:uncharacterized protein BP5553_08374 [Venustampulla echinocandica]|uniref:Uncharacterized protein n=1 Tax=Venustampulla echinocandica TaxID=2656787 RepID=A0A370TE22_9HELO|nr:uncharacterized protein BP5553_08374 [Venustampulla echinocandica]RDL32935.1 hypothetical protein BP5553_08374 [Venustampulla echinocandica]